MKYIKTFELFDYSVSENDFKYLGTSLKYGMTTAIYEFTIDSILFECSFLKLSDVSENSWTRSYKRKGGEYSEQIGANTYKIIAIITKITIDFLNKIKPEFIQIDHLNTAGEKYVGGLNKRAKINKQYLQKSLPNEYDLEYDVNPESTLCKIYLKNSNEKRW